tara:strand:+ start:496 stop:1086 length:591 start_codon:yes stop_codon:yes gene_type:complete
MNEIVRKMSLNLSSEFAKRCQLPSDINEHLPTLKTYTENCDHVTVMGVGTDERRGTISTFAFLAGMPKTLIAYDYKMAADLDTLNSVANENEIDFVFHEADTRKIAIEETELLFIDTLHTYRQLKEELRLHGNRASKYLIFHDVVLFADTNEDGDDPIDGKVGLRPAIDEFLDSNKHWYVQSMYQNNNGLLILKRV